MKHKIRCLPTGFYAVFVLTPCIFFSTTTLARDWTDDIKLSGFVSSVYEQSNNEAFYAGNAEEAGVDDNGSFAGTRFGLNVNAKVNRQLSVAAQLFASRKEEAYATVVDWAFASVRLPADLHIRAGKIKFPVGLVNEYVDVGYAYTFMRPPTSVYSEDVFGAQVTQEAYTGYSLLWDHSAGDWTMGMDLFFGDTAGEVLSLRKMTGVTFKLDWNYAILLQASAFQGEVLVLDETFLNPLAELDLTGLQGEKHQTTIAGLKMDWNNIILYAEYATVDQEDFEDGKASAYYGTLGYRIGSFTPYVTFESFEKAPDSAEPNEQNVSTVGLRYDFLKNAALKAEYSQIKVESGEGLFELEAGQEIEGETVNKFGLALDFIF